jgi:hypothetical protein
VSSTRPEVLPTLTEVIDLALPPPTAQPPLPLAPDSVPLEGPGEAAMWDERALVVPTAGLPSPAAQAATAAVVAAVVQSLAPRLERWIESHLGADLEASLREALEQALAPALERALILAREQLHAELPELVRAALDQARRDSPPR